MFSMDDEISRIQRKEEIEVFGYGFLRACSDKYLSDNIIGYENQGNSLYFLCTFEALKSHLLYLDDFNSFELIVFEKF